MPGYEADPRALGAAATVLRDTADTLTTDLDPGICATLGPGRLGPVAATFTEAARDDLDHARTALTEDADLLTTAAHGYTDLDHTAAADLTRRGGERA